MPACPCFTPLNDKPYECKGCGFLRDQHFAEAEKDEAESAEQLAVQDSFLAQLAQNPSGETQDFVEWLNEQQ